MGYASGLLGEAGMGPARATLSSLERNSQPAPPAGICRPGAQQLCCSTLARTAVLHGCCSPQRPSATPPLPCASPASLTSLGTEPTCWSGPTDRILALSWIGVSTLCASSLGELSWACGLLTSLQDLGLEGPTSHWVHLVPAPLAARLSLDPGLGQ